MFKIVVDSVLQAANRTKTAMVDTKTVKNLRIFNENSSCLAQIYRARINSLYVISLITAMNSEKMCRVSHLCQIYVSNNDDSGVDNRLVNLLYFSRCKSWRDVRVVYGAGLENQ